MKVVDLHCHSTISDGLLPPAEVVRRAVTNGVDLLALTDHDDVAGLGEARATAEELGLAFLDGAELSVSWRDTTIHIVGLRLTPDHPALLAGLAALRAGRDSRAERIATALEKAGIPGALEGALRHAKNATIVGRAHFARYLVEQGVASDVKSVFDHYLVAGKPGYVPHHWITLNEALNLIHGAGGVAVIAHPIRYRISRSALREFIAEFKERGGAAMEVACGAHTPEHIRECAALARHFGLKASSASDFHGPGESYADLGRVPTMPDGLVPIWKELV